MYEERATRILKRKGFANIKKVSGESFDLMAEKEGIRYCVEVKGTGQRGVMGRYVVPQHELRALYAHYRKDKEKTLLMFVDDYENYCMFEMVDGFII
jgi:Holliday junction resolvase